MRIAVARGEFYRAAQAGFRVGRTSRLLQRDAQTEVSLVVLGHPLHGATKELDRLCRFAAGRQQPGEVAVRDGEIRLQCKRPPVAAFGDVCVSKRVERDPKVVVRVSTFRRKLYGPSITLYGLRMEALVGQRMSERRMRGREVVERFCVGRPKSEAALQRG